MGIKTGLVIGICLGVASAVIANEIYRDKHKSDLEQISEYNGECLVGQLSDLLPDISRRPAFCMCVGTQIVNRSKIEPDGDPVLWLRIATQYCSQA